MRRPSTGFRGSIATLLTGTVVAHAVTFSAAVVLTRIYDAAVFGVYSAFLSVVAITGILSTGALDKAIVFQRSRRRFVATVLAVGAFSVVVAAIALVIGSVARWFGPDRLRSLLGPASIVAIAASALGTAATQAYTMASLRAGRTWTVAAARIGQSVVTVLVQIALGLLGVPFGLGFGYVAGLVLALPLTLGELRRSMAGSSSKVLPEMRATLRRLSIYPRATMPAELLDSVANQAPMLLVGAAFSLETLGYYGLAQRMLGAPAALLGQAVGQSFLHRIGSPSMTHSDIRQLMFRIWRWLLLAGVAPLALVLVWGPDLFAFAFGGEWREAGEIARVSAVLWLGRFVSSPTSTVVYRLGLQRQHLALAGVALAVRSAPYVLAFGGLSLTIAILLHTAGELSLIACYNALALRRLRSTLAVELADAPRAVSAAPQ